MNYRIIDILNSLKEAAVAAQHKIVITVKAQRTTVSISMRGHGTILSLPLAGYNEDLSRQPMPTTASQKAYVTAILDTVIANLT